MLIGTGTVRNTLYNLRKDRSLRKLVEKRIEENHQAGLSNLIVEFTDAIDAGVDGFIKSVPVSLEPEAQKLGSSENNFVTCSLTLWEKGGHKYAVAAFNPPVL